MEAPHAEDGNSGDHQTAYPLGKSLKGGQPADLGLRDLRNYKLDRVNLKKAKLAGANLQDAINEDESVEGIDEPQLDVAVGA